MIKAFIIAAVTADGFIAKNRNHPASWTSREDKRRFVALTKRAGVVIMGSSTYATIGKPLKERTNIIYSHSKTFEGVEMTQKQPQELLTELESRGFKEAAICGGCEIYTMYIKAGVVDKVYLTVEPLFFGKGVRLFSEEIENKLTLISLERAENNTVLLEYEVMRDGV